MNFWIEVAIAISGFAAGSLLSIVRRLLVIDTELQQSIKVQQQFLQLGEDIKGSIGYMGDRLTRELIEIKLSLKQRPERPGGDAA